MTIQKISAIITAVIVCFSHTLSVGAASVGEDIYFSADVIEDSNIGNTTIVNKTEEEHFWSSVNSSNNDEIQNKVTELIKEIIENNSGDYIQLPDSIIIVVDGETNIDDLTDIADYSDEYYPGGDEYKTTDKRRDNANIVLSDEERSVIADVAVDRGFEVVDVPIQDPTEIAPSEDSDEQYTIVVLPDGTEVIDYPTFEERYTEIEDYVNTFIGEETIGTKYILEIKA